jgi:hypothetical protein
LGSELSYTLVQRNVAGGLHSRRPGIRILLTYSSGDETPTFHFSDHVNHVEPRNSEKLTPGASLVIIPMQHKHQRIQKPKIYIRSNNMPQT